MEIEKKIEVEITKGRKKPDLLLRDGSKIELEDLRDLKKSIKKSDVRGIILGSGKIVSLNIYGPFKFSESNLKNYPKERMIGDSIELVKKDSDGQTNTDYLNLFCDISKINALNCFSLFDEYLPSVGEMLEVIRETDRINNIRKLLNHLEPLPKDVWYWTSTIRDEESVWTVRSSGDVYWRRRSYAWDGHRVISFLGS